ncbi:MAG TPA: hypothetical protein VK154_04045 [Chitinophagales bacterium]|nr:hypothetical protein [Chitinophagales bacterium]
MSTRIKVYYYISFALFWGIVTFILSMALFDYEDRGLDTSNWWLWPVGYKLAFIGFCVVRFPVGTVIDWLTGWYISGFFLAWLNPLFWAWLLTKITKTRSERFFRNISTVHFVLVAFVVLLVAFNASR